MTFDSVDELHKIKTISPDAQVVLRIVTDDSGSVCQLSNKFGASLCDVPQLLDTAKELGLDCVGTSFHVGSGSSDLNAFKEPLTHAAWVFEQAKSRGIEMSLLDIGGGFPGDDAGEVSFEQIAQQINPLLDNLFPKEVNVIAEPGRFFSHSCGTIATKVIARRFVTEQAKKDAGAGANAPDIYYYIGDGTYGSFNCMIADHYTPEEVECLTDSKKMVTSRVFGPTCDGFDTIYDSK